MLAAATLVITLGPREDVPLWAYGAMVFALVLAALAATWRDDAPERRSRAPFRLALTTAAVSILLLVARGSSLS